MKENRSNSKQEIETLIKESTERTTALQSIRTRATRVPTRSDPTLSIICGEIGENCADEPKDCGGELSVMRRVWRSAEAGRIQRRGTAGRVRVVEMENWSEWVCDAESGQMERKARKERGAYNGTKSNPSPPVALLPHRVRNLDEARNVRASD